MVDGCRHPHFINEKVLVLQPTHTGLMGQSNIFQPTLNFCSLLHTAADDRSTWIFRRSAGVTRWFDHGVLMGRAKLVAGPAKGEGAAETAVSWQPGTQQEPSHRQRFYGRRRSA
jgi:hypothetical protein